MTEPVKLAPPGAGVPWWQRLAGKHYFLPLYCATLSWDSARDLLRVEGEKLVRMADGVDPERLVRRVLVPPQIGLEDSSRHWSYAMVLEHLVIIGSRAADVIVGLSHGRVPPGRVDTADLKPAGASPAEESVARFRSFLEEFHRRTGEEIGDRRSRARFEHPWFGPLTARQWICFLPFHQRIHIRQARRILHHL